MDHFAIKDEVVVIVMVEMAMLIGAATAGGRSDESV